MFLKGSYYDHYWFGYVGDCFTINCRDTDIYLAAKNAVEEQRSQQTQLNSQTCSESLGFEDGRPDTRVYFV